MMNRRVVGHYAPAITCSFLIPAAIILVYWLSGIFFRIHELNHRIIASPKLKRLLRLSSPNIHLPPIWKWYRPNFQVGKYGCISLPKKSWSRSNSLILPSMILRTLVLWRKMKNEHFHYQLGNYFAHGLASYKIWIANDELWVRKHVG